MFKFILWYLAIGFCVPFLIGLICAIELEVKYGFDTVKKVVEGTALDNKADFCACYTVIDVIIVILIRTVFWPVDIYQMPKRISILHEECMKINTIQNIEEEP